MAHGKGRTAGRLASIVPVAILSMTPSGSLMAFPTQSRSNVPPIAASFHETSLIMPWMAVFDAYRNECTPGAPWMSQ
jgi:hypothetical protein